MSLRLASRAIGRCVVLGVLLVTAGACPVAAQCGGSQLCGPTGDCTISADCTITVPPGGLPPINLGSRRLVLTKNLEITGPAGAGLTIIAGDVLLNGGSITALGDGSTAGTITILSATNFTVQNNTLIDVSAGVVAGLVDFEALAGDMNFAGRIKANGTTRASFGGDVTLFASGNSNVSSGTSLDVSGGDMGAGGAISIDALAGSRMAGIPLNAKGGDGGDIEMSAGTTLTTTSATTMDLSATGDAGSGGDIDISAAGNIIVGGEANSTGTPAVSSEEGQAGGDGGEYDISSDTGSITVNGKVTMNGAAAGFGGSVDWEAATHLAVSNTLTPQADGIDGEGGDVFLVAGGPLALPQQVDVRGNIGSGGSIEVVAQGTLTASATLLTDGQLGGGGMFLSVWT